MPLRRNKPLRRGKGLERGEKGLSSDPAKVRGWQDHSRAPLAPVAKAGPRRGTKATETLDARQQAARAAYGANPQPCENCGYGSKPGERLDWVEAHHPLSQEAIRRLCRSARVNPHDWLWDKRNRMWLCDEPAPNRCHTRLENGERLHSLVLPQFIYEFIDEVDDMLEAAGVYREAMGTFGVEWVGRR